MRIANCRLRNHRKKRSVISDKKQVQLRIADCELMKAGSQIKDVMFENVGAVALVHYRNRSHQATTLRGLNTRLLGAARLALAGASAAHLCVLWRVGAESRPHAAATTRDQLSDFIPNIIALVN